MAISWFISFFYNLLSSVTTKNVTHGVFAAGSILKLCLNLIELVFPNYHSLSIFPLEVTQFSFDSSRNLRDKKIPWPAKTRSPPKNFKTCKLSRHPFITAIGRSLMAFWLIPASWPEQRGKWNLVKITINTALFGDHPLTPRLTWLSVPIFVIFRPAPSRPVPTGCPRWVSKDRTHWNSLCLHVLTSVNDIRHILVRLRSLWFK